LDIKMPEINGFELYEKIKKMDNNVHILFLTVIRVYTTIKQNIVYVQ
jgi:two-component SAPR family response regulator